MGMCTQIIIKGANIKIQGGPSISGNIVVYTLCSIKQVIG